MNVHELTSLIEQYIINSAFLDDALRQRGQGKFGTTLPIEAALVSAEARREQQRIANELHAALGGEYAYRAVAFGSAPVEFWFGSNDRVIWSFVEHELERELWLNEVGDAEDATPWRDWRAPRPAPVGAHENIPY